MGTDVDIATAIAVEVAKQIPVKDVYNDALQPGTRQVGGILQDLVKSLRFVLAPFQITAALQDRFAHFIDQSIRQVPPEHRMPPVPQILGPVLEAIRYEPEDGNVYSMFSQLLSASMDRTRVYQAHPAFVQKLREMSSDEAKFLALIYSRHKSESDPYFWQYKFSHIRGSKKLPEKLAEFDDLPTGDLNHGQNIRFYIEHLTSMGLIEAKTSYEHSGIIEEESKDGLDVIRERLEVYLTEFGGRFMEAVQGKISK